MTTAHCIYMLRLWPTRREGLSRYRVTLSDARTHEQLHFADIESLIKFLRDKELHFAEDQEHKILSTDPALLF